MMTAQQLRADRLMHFAVGLAVGVCLMGLVDMVLGL